MPAFIAHGALDQHLHVCVLQAVTRNELYGCLHPTTREWKEGLVSVTFRDYANNKTNKHQWIVLDGDIDAEWIEASSFYLPVCFMFMALAFACHYSHSLVRQTQDHLPLSLSASLTHVSFNLPP